MIKADFNDTGSRISFYSADPKDHRILERFPGLLRDGPYYFLPPEPRIVYNVISRLKTKVKSLALSPTVQALYRQDFRLKDIPLDFKFFTEPKPFQIIALRYIYSVGGGGLLLEPGMGKTKIVLDFTSLMGFDKVLIVCPKPLQFVWEEERKLHRPDKSMYVVTTTDWATEKEGIYNNQISVINYNKAVIFADELVKVGFNLIAIDEALIKDPGSQRTKSITWMGYRIEHKLLMSGTLINNSPLEVFAPTRFMEPALTGTSYGNFRDEYAVTRKDPVNANNRLIVGFRKIPEMKSILESVSIVMTKEEWLKLPPKKFIDITAMMSDEQRDVYDRLSRNYITTLNGETVEVDNVLVMLTKLIQISNGFLYVSYDDSIEELTEEKSPKRKKKTRNTLFFKEQPKLDVLTDLVTGQLKNRRGIIWFNMSAEYELISNRLKRDGITFIDIRGGEKNVGDKIKLFNSDPRYSWLVCQAKSVNYGVTVLGKDYDEAEFQIPIGIIPEVYTQIFYSLNFSLEVYLQQQDRIHRIGQEHECEYYRIIANTAADRGVAEKLTDKLILRGQVLVDFIKSLGIYL